MIWHHYNIVPDVHSLAAPRLILDTNAALALFTVFCLNTNNRFAERALKGFMCGSNAKGNPRPSAPGHRLFGLSRVPAMGFADLSAQHYRARGAGLQWRCRGQGDKVRGVVELTPPPPCASTLKVIKTTVTRAPVLRQARACARRAVPKERMSPETCPYLTLSTIVATRALQHNVQANFSEFWRSSLPIRAIRSCGIEALSHLAPHLEQLHMLALWGSLWVTAMPGVAT